MTEANGGPADGPVLANGDSAQQKKSRAEKLKERKKKQKLNKQLRRQENQAKVNGDTSTKPTESEDGDEEIVVEYVSAPIDLDSLAPQPSSKPETAEQEEEEEEERSGLGGLGFGGGGLGFGGGGLGFSRADQDDDVKPTVNPFDDFKKVFEKFASAERVMGTTQDEDDEEEVDARVKEEKKATTSKDEDSDDEADGAKQKLSKKQLKLLNRMKIADLKKVCDRPEVVEVWDVTAPDPPFLVFLKACRNSVPVPRHWSQKRKYLQGKRGLEKPPFKLPDFIEATGIAQMRNSYQEKEDAKKLKQKLREKMAPKMGRMDIDYQVLHDAFFKYQKKPNLTDIGELYYEGKEFEARITGARPGVLSEGLRAALGMQDNSPPPWLINMQRYGPPPSYPNLKIAGLNAPIPPGCQFGYHAGGWGKPPVDEEGNPLYGDVFAQVVDAADSDDEVDRGTVWGQLEELESEEEEEEEEEEEDEDMDEDDMREGIASGLASGMVSGMASGIASSLPSGIETPDTINLRKQAGEDAGPRQLYTVLEQKQVSVGATGIMGTDHVYVLPGADKKGGDKKRPDFLKNMPTDIELAISPEDLEGLDDDQVRELYESRVAELKSANKREDFSDMVAAKAAQQKRKIAQKAEAKAAKKAKGDTFKF